MIQVNPNQLIQLKNQGLNAGQAKVKKVLKTVIQVTYAAANYSISQNDLSQNIHGQIWTSKEVMKALTNRKVTISRRKR
jgi:hypothetical protein